ncbi:hypothetical protein LL14B4_06040 [Lactococcus lactis subsp. lactis]|uniref:Lipoprotein n=1 Tax=Lactococcus lactis subsp. lactis TaxID=1360 RepID=A0A2Z3KG62_LACLL|nr:hypothetical protein [Lactococcus lactis]AWN65761.1 hypothetical protein LL14B4_06040 [Lactococcus lactis subsp. lactis]
MKKTALIGLTLLTIAMLASCSNTNSSSTRSSKEISTSSKSSISESTDAQSGKAKKLVDSLNLEKATDSKDKLDVYADNATKLKENGYVVIVRGDFLLKDYKTVETNFKALSLNVTSVEGDELGEDSSGKVDDIVLPDQVSFTSDYLGYWYYVTPKNSNVVINYYK